MKIFSKHSLRRRLFDAKYYLLCNPDVRRWRFGAERHFRRYGWRERRNPHPLFDTRFYLDRNPLLEQSNVNPLEHFLRHGCRELQCPHCCIDVRYLVRFLNDRIDSTTIPFLYYLEHGGLEGRLTEELLKDLRALAHATAESGASAASQKTRIAVILHLYYPDLWDSISHYIRNISEPFDLYVSFPKFMFHPVLLDILSEYPQAHLLPVENRGRDILPFIREYMRGSYGCYDYVCKIHTKRSPHIVGGDSWRTELFESLLASPHAVSQIITYFDRHDEVGLVGAENYIHHASSDCFWSSNIQWLSRLVPKLQPLPRAATWRFLAGSMFWFRPKALAALRMLDLHEEGFEQELGQYDGTLAHALERLLLLLVEKSGFCIATMRDVQCKLSAPARDLAATPSPVHAVSIRDVVRDAFDSRYYLDHYPDVHAAGVDPLDHYLAQGASERRDPGPHFNTSYYYCIHPELVQSGVNPLYHWVVAGKICNPVLTDGYRIRQLESILNDETAFSHELWENYNCRCAEWLTDKLLTAVRGGKLSIIVVFSHDNYVSNVGGLQMCIALEQKSFYASAACHLALYPAVRTDSFCYDSFADTHVLGVVLNGNDLGYCRGRDVRTALDAVHKRFKRIPASIHLHALHGHCLEFVLSIIASLCPTEVNLFVHDFYTICPSMHLMRNRIIYCGAPPPGSAACGVCVYGEQRIAHIEKIKTLFSTCDVTVVAPSVFALDLWQAKSGLLHKEAVVRPHTTFRATGVKMAPSAKHLRVAFVGLPIYHKGWDAYVNLAKSFQNDDRYSFYAFSSFARNSSNIQWRIVTVSADNRDAMSKALSREGIDIVVLWSLCPETFSFTAQEARTAGAFIITTETSGNIAHVVRECQQGLVLADDAQLMDVFSSGRVIKAFQNKLRSGIPTGYLEYNLGIHPR